jgi:hypothetical protein
MNKVGMLWMSMHGKVKPSLETRVQSCELISGLVKGSDALHRRCLIEDIAEALQFVFVDLR